MQFAEYRSKDALALAELVKKREISAPELLEVAVARLEDVNASLNSVVIRCLERAQTRAANVPMDAPFAGVPFLVKDLDGVLGGVPYTGSSRSLASYVPTVSSTLFDRYDGAGLLIFGKTNTPEFGIFGVTESELRGPARNPWNTEHTPGGSSGGSAAAVAAGIVPMAHGGDGGGSIRIPASCCGLFGLKPSRGRMPLGPDVGEGWNGLVAPHVLSRSVRDSAAALDATAGADVGALYVARANDRPFLEEVRRDPGRLRIGVVRTSLFGNTTAPDCEGAIDHAAKLLASLGHDVVDCSLAFDRDAMRRAYLVIVAAGVAQQVNATAALTGHKPIAENFEAPTWFLWQVGNALSACDLETARATFHRGVRTVSAAFETLDVVLTATMAYPPVKVGELAPKAWERAGLAFMRTFPNRAMLEKVLDTMASTSLEKTPNTMLFNMTGQPAMSVPLAWNGDGLPIGVQFVGRLGDEATLFRLAGQLEQAAPWFDRVPA